MPSFDVVSKVPGHEVDNALMQSQKEISQRFDFKDTNTTVERTKEGLLVSSGSADRLHAAVDVLKEKMIKRGVSLKFLDDQEEEPTGKGGAKMLIKIKEGIESEPAKKMVAAIKAEKLKVQASIQDQQLRITGKNRDDLQTCIQFLKNGDFNVELQFNNFRD